MVNKKYVDSKIFTLDVTKGPDMNGSKDINVADPTSATDGSNKRYFDTKTSNSLKSDGTRVMTGNLNMNSRSIINVQRAQCAHAANVNFVNTTISESNVITQLPIILKNKSGVAYA